MFSVFDANTTQAQQRAAIQRTQQNLAREALFNIRASNTNHVNILKMVGVFESVLHEPSLHLVYQHVSGSSVERVLLQDNYARSNKRGDVNLLIRILLETAIGVESLHKIDIVHGNLACKNLLLDTGFHVW